MSILISVCLVVYRADMEVYPYRYCFPLIFPSQAIRFKGSSPLFDRIGCCLEEDSDFSVLIERVGGEVLAADVAVFGVYEGGFGVYHWFLGCSGIDSYTFEARYRLGIGCHFGWIRHTDGHRDLVFYFLRKDTEDTIVSEILSIHKDLFFGTPEKGFDFRSTVNRRDDEISRTFHYFLSIEIR